MARIQDGKRLQSVKLRTPMGLMVIDAYHKKILQWLSLTDPSINHVKARQRHERTTGAWFLTSEELQTWKIEKNSFMWLHGLGKRFIFRSAGNDTNTVHSWQW